MTTYVQMDVIQTAKMNRLSKYAYNNSAVVAYPVTVQAGDQQNEKGPQGDSQALKNIKIEG